jgi:hypothetical protein
LYEMFSSKVTANNVMSSSTKCIIIIEAGWILSINRIPVQTQYLLGEIYSIVCPLWYLQCLLWSNLLWSNLLWSIFCGPIFCGPIFEVRTKRQMSLSCQWHIIIR